MKQATCWKDAFLFVGNNIVLDFLNTCPVQNGESLELLPDYDGLLRWFKTAGLLTSREADALERRWRSSTKAMQAHKEILEFRETLRNAVLRWEAGKPVHRRIINQVNRLMMEHPMLTRLNAARATPATELYFKANEPRDLLAPLAHGAATLFATVDQASVRKCRHCILHFHDTSKKRSRQWCSMNLCGNRAKVAAYAARIRRQLS